MTVVLGILIMPGVGRVLEFTSHPPGDVHHIKTRSVTNALHSFPRPDAGTGVTPICLPRRSVLFAGGLPPHLDEQKHHHHSSIDQYVVS